MVPADEALMKLYQTIILIHALYYNGYDREILQCLFILHIGKQFARRRSRDGRPLILGFLGVRIMNRILFPKGKTHVSVVYDGLPGAANEF